MKKFVLLGALLGCSGILAAADKWTGYISDADCVADQEEHPQGEVHAHCAQNCIKRGEKPMLWISDKQSFKFADVVQGKVVPYAGQKVTIVGELDPATNTITVISDIRK